MNFLKISKFFLCIFIIQLPLNLIAQNITTVAGGGLMDLEGKLAIGISIKSVFGIAVDSLENLYYIDDNRKLLKVDSQNGRISIIAGNGTTGFTGDDGPAIDARIASLNSICIDKFGNIYILESTRVRKIDKKTGIISTYAGGGSSQLLNIPANQVTLINPRSIISDSKGNLYICEPTRIKKVDVATGIISLVAGNGNTGNTGDGGLATNASFGFISAISIDKFDNIYLCDNNNSVIRKINHLTKIISRVAGSGLSGDTGDGGNALNARLQSPGFMTTDADGNIYISTTTRIRKISVSNGIISTMLGSNGLLNPQFLVASVTGNIFVSDFGYNYIRRITQTGESKVLVGNGAVGVSGIGGLATDAQINSPRHIALDKQNNIYYTDNLNHRVFKIDGITKKLNVFAGTGLQGINQGNGGLALNANFTNPSGIATDSLGNVYFVDNGIGIRKIDIKTGIITNVAGSGFQFGFAGDGGPAVLARINRATGVTIDKFGNLYITDRENSCIRKVDGKTGIITTVAGVGTQRGYSGDDDLAVKAQLNYPMDLAVANNGDLYISDYGNNVIRKVTASTGIISTIAGTGSASFSGDNGLAKNASIRNPFGITIDKGGNIVFADQANSRIRKINIVTGIITTIAGNGFTTYSGDNDLALKAAINNPTDVLFDSDGNLIIADAANNRIRKVEAVVEPTPIYYSVFSVSNVTSNSANIEWRTSGKDDISFFEIFKGPDSLSLNLLAKVDVLDKAKTNYSFTDNNIKKEIQYYRVKQVNNDKAIKVSQLLSYDFTEREFVSVFPNPVKDVLKFSDNISYYSLIDFNGKVIRDRINLNLSGKTQQISELRAGVYIIILEKNDSTIIKQKLIVN